VAEHPYLRVDARQEIPDVIRTPFGHQDRIPAPAPHLRRTGTVASLVHRAGQGVPVVTVARRAQRVLDRAGGRVVVVDGHAGGVGAAPGQHAEHRHQELAEPGAQFLVGDLEASDPAHIRTS
jgi:hypothetical protein